jgi:hypothetical protein
MVDPINGREYFEQKLMQDPAVQALDKPIQEITPIDIMNLPPIPGLKILSLGGLTVEESMARRSEVFERSEEFLGQAPNALSEHLT